MTILAVLAGDERGELRVAEPDDAHPRAAFDLVADLDFARSEAIKRNGDVVVAPVGGSWNNGWTVAAGGTTLRQRGALGAQVAFDTPEPGALTYNARRARHRSGTRTVPDLPAVARHPQRPDHPRRRVGPVALHQDYSAPSPLAPDMRSFRQVAGFAMIEVMVTVVVVAFGLLGIAGLVSRSFVTEVEGTQRTQALLLLQDMASRIEANRGQRRVVRDGRHRRSPATPAPR